MLRSADIASAEETMERAACRYSCIGRGVQRANSVAAPGDEVLVSHSADESSQGPRLNNHDQDALASLSARLVGGVEAGNAMGEGLVSVIAETRRDEVLVSHSTHEASQGPRHNNHSE